MDGLIPVPVTTLRGPPIDDQLRAVFAPWGQARGVAVLPHAVVVEFEGGYQLSFVPLVEPATAGLVPA